MPGCLAGGRGRATTAALQWSVYIIILLSYCISFCFPVLRILSAALLRCRVHRYQERRFRARPDGGGAGSDGGAVAVDGRVMAALLAGPVERHDVHERRVRAGHQGDERNQHDGHVLGHGPAAHALTAAPRRPAAAPPPLWLSLHRLEVRVVVHRVVVAVKVQVVLRVGRVVRVLSVLIPVVPERGQVDYGRTHQAQY